MNKYATLDEDVADVAGDEHSIQKEGRVRDRCRSGQDSKVNRDGVQL